MNDYSNPIQYIAKTWPHSARTPHEGAHWDALTARVDGLVEAYGPDKVCRAVFTWCESHGPQIRPTAQQLADLMVELYPATLVYSDKSKDVWCDDEALGILQPVVSALDDDAKASVRVLTQADGTRAVCEWLCANTPALALIEQVKRGAPLNIVDDMVRRVAA